MSLVWLFLELISLALCVGGGAVDVPQGILRGCLSLEQIEDYLVAVEKEFDEIVVRKSIGTSIEGRPMTALCIGVCKEGNKMPQGFFNAMHHSREGISMMSVIYTIDSLLRGYLIGQGWAKSLIETRTMWFLPVVNPDGYMYNQRMNPRGGGWQRKNRRKECGIDSKLGVDLNRNYPVCFNRNDDGASTNPCHEDYKGKAPFSEPETQAIKKFVEESNFTVALNIHSYGRLMLIPFSCQALKYPPNQDEKYFQKYAIELARANQFVVGRPYEKVIDLYSVNGDAADWMYREHKIFSASPEVGGGGFWAPEGKVLYFAKENIPMILHSAWSSGPLLQIENVALSFYSDNSENEGAYLDIAFQPNNAGLWHSFGDVIVTAKMLDRDEKVTSSSFSNIGQLHAKYENNKQVKMRVDVSLDDQKRSIKGKGLMLTISDSYHCTTYVIEQSSLPINTEEGSDVDLNFEIHKDAKMKTSSAQECKPIHQSSSSSETKQPTETNTSPEKTKTLSPTTPTLTTTTTIKETEMNPAMKFSQSLYNSPLLSVGVVFGITFAVGFILVKCNPSKREYSELRTIGGSDGV